MWADNGMGMVPGIKPTNKAFFLCDTLCCVQGAALHPLQNPQIEQILGFCSVLCTLVCFADKIKACCMGL